MSTAVTFGWNGNPDSLTIITSGSSTIAAGKYARITVQCYNGGSIALDGTTVLRARTWTVLSSSTLKSVTLTSPPDVNTGSGTTQPDTYLVTAALNTSTPSVVSDTNANTVSSAFSGTTHEQNVVAEYWLPTGTTVAITGNAVVVIQIFS